MVHRLGLVFLTVASVLLLVTFVVPGGAAQWLFAVLVSAFPPALIVVGASRAGRLGPSLVVLVTLLTVVLESTVLGMMLLRGTAADVTGWIFGVPTAAVLQIAGLFALPLVVTGLGYAWSFDRWALSDDDLAALRARHGRRDRPEPR